MSDQGVQASVDKMREAGVSDAAIESFRHYWELLRDGDPGVVAESDIEPLDDPQELDDLPEPGGDAREVVDRAVVVKLNGGLGTSMGMDRAKSLIEAKDGLSFLDLIARQVVAARRASGARVPLVLMNSFHTRADTLAALERHPELRSDVPPDFVQSRVPKVRADDLQPVSWPQEPELEWAPPGHGDVYTSLLGSGMLDTLLEHGYRYAFLSNSDNLGAVLEPRILAWMAREGIPFVSEVADRTDADRKGGHLARRRADGRLVLRETAQTRPEDQDASQDVGRHRYFNTNNLWVDLEALRAVLERQRGVLRLPMIVNRKTVDPTDPDSTPVVQLETAMGAAVGSFEGARALHVSRRRFAPVKTTDDLLVLRSDAYLLGDGGRVELAAGRTVAPLAELDPKWFKLLRDFEARFPAGPPSLVGCDRLTVRGDVRFGRGVVVRGSVVVEQDGSAQLAIEDGAVLEG